MMLRAFLCLFLAVSNLSAALTGPETRVIFAMKTGILLRMHVVAQDDTAEMQRIKLVVRDAVRQTYDSCAPDPARPMLRTAAALLPELTETAVTAARGAGFTGRVSVSIEVQAFDARELDGYTLPAGDYPALMIRLGDARGHNWWGLVDPELSLSAAAVPGTAPEGAPILWDWSLRALLSALLGLPLTAQEDSHA